MSFNDFQIPPPLDWQKFERLCRDIWAKEWNDSNTCLHGRQGQPQCGVDVYGYLDGDKSKLHAVQCKGKNQLSSSIVTENELIDEVEKASKFEPKIKDFILATTGPNDGKLQKLARELSEKYAFRVSVVGWEAIVGLLGKYDDLAIQYLSDLVRNGHIDKNQSFFIEWYTKYINIDSGILSYWYNTSYLPNAFYDIGFEGAFIDRLVGFCQSINSFKSGIRDNDIDQNLFILFNSFSEVVGDIAYFINKNVDFNEIHRGNRDFSTFWLKTNGEYLNGNFIDYKKGILRALFYALVTITNTIISYYNKKHNSNYKLKSFSQDEEQSIVVFPAYESNQVYLGLNSIAEFIYEQFDRDFEFQPEFVES
ncbi:hypothetical protein [Acinetobacter bereziniae]|uniref:hypothetical protein n=1 Tax=Acinetobacter bereziniae TaxID=106648 RepID=UPI0018FF4719|nr:hypothetical protein [Acinetobacter bereziniae]MBJ8476468.1 hypothetical protein [Acinetobacter bereziniae]